MNYKRREQVLVLLTVFMFALLLPLLALNVSATTSNTTELPKLVVGTNFVKIGTEVKVAVKVVNNPGIGGMDLYISYDVNKLKLLSSSICMGSATQTAINDATTSYSAHWASTVNVEGDGTLLELTFEVFDSSTLGSSPIVATIGDNSLFYYEGQDEISYSYQIVNGEIIIVDIVPGDVTGDGVVNSRDAARILQYLAGWNVEYTAVALDTNGDGNINSRDAARILQYLADWDVVIHVTVVCDHSLTHMPAKTATCTETGNVEYWICSDCGKLFSDDSKTSVLNAIPTTSAIGHSLTAMPAKAATYTEAGNIAYWYCEICNKYFTNEEGDNEIDFASITLPVLTVSYHSITYKNCKTAEYPTQIRYAEHEGLFDLPTLSVNGYIFKGWYTASEGGEKIDYIPVDSKQNYVLFARWELKEYRITYVMKDAGATKGNNPETYTIESQTIHLNNGVKPCYLFECWKTADGTVIEEITSGSYGDLDLYPVWTSLRNKVVMASSMSNPMYENAMIEEDDEDIFTHIFYLGQIQNVPITTLSTIAYTGGSIEDTISTTVSVNESVENAITSVSKNSTSKSNSWESIKSWSNSISDQHTVKWEVGAEGTIKKVFKLSGKFGVDNQWSTSSDWSGSTSVENATVYTTEDEKGYSTSFIYSKTASCEKVLSYSISEGSPIGNYRLVTVGTVDVFGVVTFDAAENTYYIYTVSTLGSVNGIMADYSTSSNFDDCEGSFEFSIPDEVNTFTDNLIAASDSLVYMEYVENGIKYDLCVKYTGSETEIVVPAYHDGKKVTGIANTLFAGNETITSVTLGRFITAIPDSAFEGCIALEKVDCPSVTVIGNKAFKNCAKLNMTIHDAVTSIGSSAFDGCVGMNTINIGTSLISLGSKAFINCGNNIINATVVNNEIFDSVINSGAKNISISLSQFNGTLNDSIIVIPNTITSFKIDGALKEYTNLGFVADSDEIEIKNLHINNDNEQTALKISSGEVTLRHLTVNAKYIALNLTSETTLLKIGGEVNLNSTTGKIALVGKNITVDSDVISEMSTLRIDSVYSTSGQMISTDMVVVYPSESNSEISITFDPNGGTVDYSTRTYKLGFLYGTLAMANRVGYTFEGWYTKRDGGILVTASSIIYDKNVLTLYARWKANTDTAYTVKHYQMNIGGSGYTLFETQSLAGTSDASVTPLVKQYTGFSSPKPVTKIVFADGTMVIEYYYSRNIYDVYYNSNGGTNINKQTYYYGATIFQPSDPVRSGYTFNGWYSELNGIGFGSAMPAQSFTITANWILLINFEYFESTDIIVTDGDTNVLEKRIQYSSLNMDLNALKNEYSYVAFTVSFYGTEIDDGYQEVYIIVNNDYTYDLINNTFSGEGIVLSCTNIEIAGTSKGSETITVSSYAETSLLDFSEFIIAFGAHGSLDDDWKLHSFTITISFYN